MILLSPALILLGLGCGVDWCGRFNISCGLTPSTGEILAGYDGDEDGWPEDVDCYDNVAEAHPGAEEICDHYDNDCDGLTDEPWSLVLTWEDQDGDGFGDQRQPPSPHCPGEAYATNNLDCHDHNPGVHPHAEEVCDGEDNDCDGTVDLRPVRGGRRARADADGDGAVDPTIVSVACIGAPGWSVDPAAPIDCDDADANTYPGAPESCDGKDNDCDHRDESIDDRMTTGVGAAFFAPDVDDDGWVVEGDRRLVCLPMIGWGPNYGDCDDTLAAVYPTAAEGCDGLDNDCDRTVDGPDAAGATDRFADLDGDGWGDVATRGCLEEGLVDAGGDCDDADPAIHPFATGEACASGVDTNCDGFTGTDDHDGDGVGACADCDDGDPAIAPGAVEVCDGAKVDEDCDGWVDGADERGPGVGAWVDADGDGIGGRTPADTCGAGTSLVTGDCDDADPGVYPGAPERCAGAVDHNCDGIAGDCMGPLRLLQAEGQVQGEAAMELGAAWVPAADGGWWIGAPGVDRVFHLDAGDMAPGVTLPIAALRGVGADDGRFGAALDREGEALFVGLPAEDGGARRAGGLRQYTADGSARVATIRGDHAGAAFGGALVAREDGLWVASPNWTDGAGRRQGRVDRLPLPLPRTGTADLSEVSLLPDRRGGTLGGWMMEVGDLDGDGLSTLAIGCAGCTAPANVQALLFDAVDGPLSPKDADRRLASPDSWGPSRLHLAAGDVDGDGRDDLLAGLPDAVPATGAQGTARLLLSTGELAGDRAVVSFLRADGAAFDADPAGHLGDTVAIEGGETPTLWIRAGAALYGVEPAPGRLRLTSPVVTDLTGPAAAVPALDLDGDPALLLLAPRSGLLAWVADP